MKEDAETIAGKNAASEAWAELVETFRHACQLHQRGRRQDAMHVVSEVLPDPLRRWSRASTESTATKRRALLALFSSEAERMGDSALMQQLFHAHLIDRSHALASARAALMGGQALNGEIRRREEKVSPVTSVAPAEEHLANA